MYPPASRYVCEPSGGQWLKSYGPVKNFSNKAYDVDAGSDVQQAIFWHLFPNVEFGVLPGEKLIGAFRFFPLFFGFFAKENPALLV